MPSTHSKFCNVSLHSREDKRNSLESFHFHICSRTTHMISIDSGKYYCKGVFQKKVVHDHQQHRQRREAQLQYTTRKFSNSVRFEFSSAEPKHEIEIQVNSTTYGKKMVIKWDIVGWTMESHKTAVVLGCGMNFVHQPYILNFAICGVHDLDWITLNLTARLHAKKTNPHILVAFPLSCSCLYVPHKVKFPHV